MIFKIYHRKLTMFTTTLNSKLFQILFKSITFVVDFLTIFFKFTFTKQNDMIHNLFFIDYVIQILKKMQIVVFENFISAISNNFKMTTKRNFENFIFIIITNNYKLTSIIFVIINFKITSIFDVVFNFHKTFIFNVNRF